MNATTEKTITLQIPVEKYGAIATMAAVMGIPLDEYLISAITDKK
jgi:hypothetical protein